MPFPFFDTNTIKLLRIPFSFFLMPVFFLAVSQCGQWNSDKQWRALLVFLVLHVFVYPASNGYNSFMDQDEGSIGGLKHPPKATIHLFYTSLFFDCIGLALSALLGFSFFIGILVYILVSRSYSWKGIRLKKYPIIGFLSVVVFQGAFTFANVLVGMEGLSHLQVFRELLFPALASSLMIGGVYPLTQVYQHEQDKASGDLTISCLLGYKGTFLFSLTLFGLAGAFLFLHFTLIQFMIFQVFLLPVALFFLYWMFLVWRDTTKADFENTMKMNTIASICMNLCFVTLFFLNR